MIAEGENLLLRGGRDEGVVDSSGTMNVVDSTLSGNIEHLGVTGDTVQINFTDSTWSGTADVSGDNGAIDINFNNSVWDVTGDSNTNGNITADSDSTIDYNDAPAGTVVEVDSLTGDPDLNMKPGDKLVIKDGNSVVNLESDNPNVIEVVKNPDNSWEIISKGDGNAELDYTYKDEGGAQHSVTIGVSASDSIETSTSGTPDADSIFPGEEVAITYSFASTTANAQALGVVNDGLAGSGLSVSVDGNGDVFLEGTAGEVGSYYYDVNMLIDGTLVTRRIVVTIHGGLTPGVTGGDPESIIPGSSVDITYDFGADNTVSNVDPSGLAGSGLTAGIDASGNVVLDGVATEPGSYYFEVEVVNADGKTIKQKMPVNIVSEAVITGEPSDGVIYPGEEVKLTYDFSPYKAVAVDNSGMDGSGLWARIVGVTVVLQGNAENSGDYYYIVTLERTDGTRFDQKVDVVVQAGSRPTSRSGGSSNCNSGVGSALFALMGLAFVYKRK